MEKAPKVRDAGVTQLRLCVAEYTGESGTVRVASYGDTGIQGGGLCTSGTGNRRPSVGRAQGPIPRRAQARLHGTHPAGSTTQSLRAGICVAVGATEAAVS